MKQDVLAIIPARGGSKGIPRKNLRPVGGVPLVVRAIRAAQQARAVTRVVVSTDDAEIAEVARAAGAEVVHRPAELGSDTASSESALLHALEELKGREGYQPELLLFLQCTSPFTRAEDLDGLVDAARREGADCALTVTPFFHFLWRARSGGLEGINHDSRQRLRRQDREREWLETGAAYLMRTAGFLEHRHRFFGRIASFAVPAERSMEIDDPAELALANQLARELDHPPSASLPGKIGAIIFDFDGVFTDNRVWVDSEGREMVQCDRSDGWGIRNLRALNVPMLVLSSEENPVVTARCRKLKLDVIQGKVEKGAVLRDWLAKSGIAAADVVYVGNDENDVECLRTVGCGIAVADAHPTALREARIVLKSSGGQGAVREVCDLIVDHLNRR